MAVFPMKPSAESTPKSSLEPSAESLPDSSVQSSTESGPEPSAQGDVDSPFRVCVDVRALSAFQSHQLLFEKHGMAWVLCDANESCTTAGHMVVFRGQVMMMNTYCDIVGCEKRSMHVNSPRNTRGLRVQSRTGGLAYTVFAARHETRMEEGVLLVVIRLGL
ncbi:hypothetical protein BWQ96_09734 [Gracilariopsis chorda]|uniref:Uncharacterized protein n=1 Tax=Gracilariopsis chorda TaxID=448386 RepID=A0A2V3IHE9_9FLOR|nr:hypothetical protein BWQ96_09734 [Gracilariopsis chorda]|eukprot:PXF40560.1 hypothetical protein BWQ96_09734 [Gracilariopsis chorda]